jgi:hypothetical protein
MKIPKSVGLEIMNGLRSKEAHVFDKWNAKQFAALGKSLQFNINKNKVIITQLQENKYNIKYNKKTKQNIMFEDIISVMDNILKGE